MTNEQQLTAEELLWGAHEYVKPVHNPARRFSRGSRNSRDVSEHGGIGNELVRTMFRRRLSKDDVSPSSPGRMSPSPGLWRRRPSTDSLGGHSASGGEYSSFNDSASDSDRSETPVGQRRRMRFSNEVMGDTLGTHISNSPLASPPKARRGVPTAAATPSASAAHGHVPLSDALVLTPPQRRRSLICFPRKGSRVKPIAAPTTIAASARREPHASSPAGPPLAGSTPSPLAPSPLARQPSPAPLAVSPPML